MSRDTLDLIDNAIADTTGPDAMRWTPDAEQEAESDLAIAQAWIREQVGQPFAQGSAGPSGYSCRVMLSADEMVVPATDIARIFDVSVDLLR